MECVGQGFPIPSIRIETPYLEGTERIASLATMQRNPKASVEIDYFTESNSGEYRCIAENEYGQRAVEYFVVNVDNGSVTPPRITVEPKFITVKVGENVLIKTSYTVNKFCSFVFQFYVSILSILFINRELSL